MEFINETKKALPVVGNYDVVVLGGGPAGVSAAVSSARSGAKTALIERYGYLGGQATGGLVILIVGLTNGKVPIIQGICKEFTDDLFQMNAAEQIGHHVLFNPEHMKLLFDAKLQENGVFAHYHSFAAGVVKKDGIIHAVITEGKSGRQAIRSKLFIDATGDADLAEFTDVPYDIMPKESLMPVTLGFRTGGVDIKAVNTFIRDNRQFYEDLIKKAGISGKAGGWIKTLNPSEAWINLAHGYKIDCTDCNDLTKAEIETRKKTHKLLDLFKKNIPGFKDAYIIDTASQIGVRDSRRIKGLYRFEQKDLSAGFDDTVCRAPNYTGSGNSSVEIPYRCLLVKKIDNIIFCGRSISIDHRFLDMIREIPCCIATGQAAGTAAGIAVSHNCGFKEIDTGILREKLFSRNVILKDPDPVKSCPAHQ